MFTFDKSQTRKKTKAIAKKKKDERLMTRLRKRILAGNPGQMLELGQPASVAHHGANTRIDAPPKIKDPHTVVNPL